MTPKLKMIANDWRSLNVYLSDLTEREVLDLLEYEKGGPRRKVFLIRLHQRYTRLRANREQREFT